ncbi:MAG: hypothetical protein ACRETL_02070, partial [Gammaproteobacteria bacterium]
EIRWVQSQEILQRWHLMAIAAGLLVSGQQIAPSRRLAGLYNFPTSLNIGTAPAPQLSAFYRPF